MHSCMKGILRHSDGELEEQSRVESFVVVGESFGEHFDGELAFSKARTGR